MTIDEGQSEEEALMREAAGWFARMRGPEAEASRQRFEAWLAADAGHRRAYSRAAEIFAIGKLLAEPKLEPVAAPARKPARRAALLAATLSLAVLAAAGWLMVARDPMAADAPALIARSNGPAAADGMLSTGASESRTARLPDGSTVFLAGATRLAIRFGPAERRLTLLEGRARFHVFHEARGFVVAAAGGSVTARGTVFEVGLSTDRRVTVRLISGRVDVRLPGRPGTRPLRPGERLAFAGVRADQGQAEVPPAEQARDAGAAREFDEAPLWAIAAEASRAASPPLIVAPELRDLRVSGRFRLDDTALLAERLASLLDLEVERQPGRLVLKRR